MPVVVYKHKGPQKLLKHDNASFKNSNCSKTTNWSEAIWSVTPQRKQILLLGCYHWLFGPPKNGSKVVPIFWGTGANYAVETMLNSICLYLKMVNTKLYDHRFYVIAFCYECFGCVAKWNHFSARRWKLQSLNKQVVHSSNHLQPCSSRLQMFILYIDKTKIYIFRVHLNEPKIKRNLTFLLLRSAKYCSSWGKSVYT